MFHDFYANLTFPNPHAIDSIELLTQHIFEQAEKGIRQHKQITQLEGIESTETINALIYSMMTDANFPKSICYSGIQYISTQFFSI